MKLMNEHGKKVVDFRGNVRIVTGWAKPKHSGSTGRIGLDGHLFYPSVVRCEWVE